MPYRLHRVMSHNNNNGMDIPQQTTTHAEWNQQSNGIATETESACWAIFEIAKDQSEIRLYK